MKVPNKANININNISLSYLLFVAVGVNLYDVHKNYLRNHSVSHFLAVELDFPLMLELVALGNTNLE